MSLILRRDCQNILDENGMGQFHVDISDQKHLRVVTECGKPLVNIHGIKFNRAVPSEAEIQYAVELFDTFFAKHRLLFKKFVDKQEEYKQLQPKEKKGWMVTYYNNSWTKSRPVAELEYEEGFFVHQVWKFLDTGEVSVRSKMVGKSELPDDFNIESLNHVKCSKKLFDKAVEYVELFVADKNRREELDDILQKVAECEI